MAVSVHGVNDASSQLNVKPSLVLMLSEVFIR